MKTSPAEAAFLTIVILAATLVFSGFDLKMLSISIGLFLLYVAIFFSGSIKDYLRAQARPSGDEED
ncbi:hypothetical protein MD273_15040 [Marinobacter pelagius]|uniref:hypothetical protein n=1 Tax=Marinobacter sp. C7 TaxID=2951363 RepID=UPI001EF11924|nr:hypothetical protein [Marinobacter sp. C7]MCG7201048.1 hypothetical protein [Marinobacter sp. C7]